jgi:hypothetical protein
MELEMAIDFPNSPALDDTFTVGTSVWRYDGQKWLSLGVAGPTGPTGATGATGATGPTGPQGGGSLKQVLVYTSNATFTKASYPWLAAVRVKIQGGGGGGGGVTNSSSAASAGGGGGAGGYVEYFLSDVSALPSSISIVVGAGGSGGSGGGAGIDGQQSSAGGFHPSTTLYADGGSGGGTGDTSPSSTLVISGGAGGGTSANGILNIAGQGGFRGLVEIRADSGFVFSRLAIGGAGANSLLGFGGPDSPSTNASSRLGTNAVGYGAGGSGSSQLVNSSFGGVNGGNGSAGIVIVELYS